VSSGFPGYLDFASASDHLRGPEAEKISPTPVVVLAQLNRLADQAFAARAFIGWKGVTGPGQQLVVRPFSAGGCVISEVRCKLTSGDLECTTLAANLAADLPGNANVIRMETGGPLTVFAAGIRDFEAIAGVIQDPNGGSFIIPDEIFVPAGNIFVMGKSNNGNVTFDGTCVVREVPVMPLGF